MIDDRGSRIIATANRNSNLVLAIMHRLPPGRFGTSMLDGLREFGVSMLVGVEPRVYLIARAVRGRDFAGRNANANPLFTSYIGKEERERRVRQHLRSLGYDID